MTNHRSDNLVGPGDIFFVREAHFQVLEAVCNTLIPEIAKEDKNASFWKRKASDIEVPHRVLEAIALQSKEEQRDFARLLSILANPLAGLIFAKSYARFDQLPSEKQTLWLQKWSRSPFQPLRAGFTILKKLTCFIFYSVPTMGKKNPNWEAIGYPGPLTPPPQKPKPIQPLTLSQTKTLSCEILVIGSGAGGGVVAGELAAAGKDVLVVEKGSYLNESDFNQQEYDMMELYERKGALSSSDGSMTILAGSCLGGGTTLNWAGTLRTPEYILHEWARDNDVPDFISQSYQESLDAAALAISTNTSVVQHNQQNKKLQEGGIKLGHLIKSIPQNIKTDGEVDQRSFGYSCMGDQYGHKQSMLNTYLEKARQNGASFLMKTAADRIIVKHGKAVGIEATQELADGSRREITIHADKVILSAGALHTPAILLRSAINHQEIGRNLFLHPVANVSAFYKETINSWWGGMMTATNDEFMHLDGNYGFKMETPPTHPGIMGMSLQWESGEQHKSMMLKAPHLCSFIVLTRDRFGGRIKLDKAGQPTINYSLHPYDLNHLIAGVKQGILVHRAAGAKRVMTPHNSQLFVDDVSEEQLGIVLRSMRWKPNMFNLFSAHQMGTCRIGGNKHLHPVAPNGEMYQVKNLFVADASAFPRSSGANPMLSVEALAHYIAKGLV